jgi:hypothetical protein
MSLHQPIAEIERLGRRGSVPPRIAWNAAAVELIERRIPVPFPLSEVVPMLAFHIDLPAVTKPIKTRPISHASKPEKPNLG